MTNNPAGKPKGSKNKLQLSIKTRVVEYLNNDFDDFIFDLDTLPVKDRTKAKLELVKLIVPRPLNDEEINALSGVNPLLEKLFGKKKEE